jgi:hypothetical protein
MRWAGALAAVLLLGACSTMSSVKPAPSPASIPSQSPVARQALPPAKSLPIVALCSQQLTPDQNGVAGPLLCTDGALNVLAWSRVAPLTPHVLSVGPAASVQAVQAALCRDINLSHAAVADELSAYDLAAAYYGWHLSTDPTAILFSMSTCPR